MEIHERIRTTMQEPDTAEGDKLIFSPKEVSEATGLTRATIKNRAERLGIERKGFYTLDEAHRIVTYPLKRVTAYSERHVELLKAKLTERMGIKPADDCEWQHRWPWEIEGNAV